MVFSNWATMILLTTPHAGTSWGCLGWQATKLELLGLLPVVSSQRRRPPQLWWRVWKIIEILSIQNIFSANPASKSVAQNYLNTGARRESRCCRVRHVQHHGGERPVESEDRGREQTLTKLKNVQSQGLNEEYAKIGVEVFKAFSDDIFGRIEILMAERHERRMNESSWWEQNWNIMSIR